uniref:ShKT domain-containing protein n=1 Tax=Elaeophora elaphi TaxID=1147741 RepID=A0A0R3RKM2_9BILA
MENVRWRSMHVTRISAMKLSEEKQCEHEDSKCIDATKKKNICIWLKTPADNITVLTSTTAPVTVPTIITAPVTVPTTTTPHAILTTNTPEICQDKAAPNKPSDCPLHSDLCNEPVYAELMKDQCPKTCGYCNPATTTLYTT